MPARKKPKQQGDTWLIICDGLCIDKAPTEARAKTKKREWEKLYPSHMNFEIKHSFWGVDLAGSSRAHVTTA